MTNITYLAGPYSKGNDEARLARFRALTHVAAKLIGDRKIVVYSPITMTHPIDLVFRADGTSLDSNFWVAFDVAFMQYCSAIIVLKLPGWEQSSGVAREIEYFRKRGIDPEFVEPIWFGVEAEDKNFAAAFS